MTDSSQAKVKLYWLNQSRSQRIVWLLEELKVDYEVEIFHRNKATYLAPPSLEKIHSLGKSPVVSITPPNGGDDIVLAESGWMTQYLVEHFPEGQKLMPKRWKDGMENQIGGETEGWMRWWYIMHYAEGSLMPILVMALILGRLKSDQVPFIVRPITSVVANRIFSMFVYPNARKHLRLIEEQLRTSPDNGKYICGPELTAADIMMSFPLIAAKDRWNDMGEWEGGSWDREFPRVKEYVELLEAEQGYKLSCEKIEKLESEAAAKAAL
ncbi:hypothetical protein N3K66_007462 [Trichothecium roseum]|uniref:Uncharacterized protein n=1 Tax=Trichothecium roseum TaxID=47278 RepID=A0ACC0UU26_9HYPO|nr:hypothetical protein N3K66_007462 [Trichothecium roseum]